VHCSSCSRPSKHIQPPQMALTHSLTHSPTHSHSHLHSHFHFHSLTLFISHSPPSLSHFLTHSFSHMQSLMQSHTHTQSFAGCTAVLPRQGGRLTAAAAASPASTFSLPRRHADALCSGSAAVPGLCSMDSAACSRAGPCEVRELLETVNYTCKSLDNPREVSF
jgi:hypothetical protein